MAKQVYLFFCGKSFSFIRFVFIINKGEMILNVGETVKFPTTKYLADRYLLNKFVKFVICFISD